MARPANVAPNNSPAILQVISENKDVGGQRATSLKHEVMAPRVYREVPNASATAQVAAIQSSRAGQLRFGERTTMDARIRNSTLDSHGRSESPTGSGSITSAARPKSILKPSTPHQPITVTQLSPRDNSWYTEHAYTTTPRFSRLGLPAKGVVLPLSAKEYKKKKESVVAHQPGSAARSSKISQSLSRRAASRETHTASCSREGTHSPSGTGHLLPVIPNEFQTPIFQQRRSQKPFFDVDCVGKASLAIDPVPALHLLDSPTNPGHSMLSRYDSVDSDNPPSSGTASSASSTLADESGHASRDTDKSVNSPSESDFILISDDDIEPWESKPAATAGRRESILRRVRCLRWMRRTRMAAFHPSVN